MAKTPRDAEEAAGAIELLIEQEADRRVAIYLAAGACGQRANDGGSGAGCVIERLEEEAKND